MSSHGLEGRRIVDIGYGTGHLHHRLLSEGAASVGGIEFNADDLAGALLPSRGGPGLDSSGGF